MKKQLFISLTILLSSATVCAAPTVSGLTISWPDDGWYQVQDTINYSEVCSGGRSCLVPEPGTYVVINHSTGQRFNSVLVEGGGSGNVPDDSGVVVNGTTLSWPDDGWYQVQRKSDYAQVCVGGLSCEVEPGLYIVINHTTGKRFDNIEVLGDSQTPTAITITGNTLSWPDDGWYQVQDAHSYASLCQGGQSCQVPAGVYNLINLTTGIRYDGIVVGSDATSPDILIPAIDSSSDTGRVISGLHSVVSRTLIDLNQRLQRGSDLTGQEEKCLDSYDSTLGEQLLAMHCDVRLAVPGIDPSASAYVKQAAFYDTEACQASVYNGNADNCYLQYASVSLGTKWVVLDGHQLPTPVYPGATIDYAIDDTSMHIESITPHVAGYFKFDVNLENGQTSSNAGLSNSTANSIANYLGSMLIR